MNNQSSYNRWSWIVALILGLILLWMLLTGRGPSSACCVTPAEVTLADEVMPAVPAVASDTCSFSASNTEFSSNQACANMAWLVKSDELKSYLVGDLHADGDDKTVVLAGTVDSESVKTQKGQEVQAFFGLDVMIDNQITVKAAEPAAITPPIAAKLYFDTGKTSLPSDADTTIAPIIQWLNEHPESKAVLSGFHDSRGNQEANEDLAYNRAKAAQAALIAAGVDVMRIEFVKPEVVDGGSDLAEARRVEVSIK
jgi:outer membrane protein OmpA-like peptidoglycan-associated protein